MTYNWLELGEKTGTIVYTLQVSCVALPPQIYVSFWTYSFAKSLARILSLWCFLKHSSKRYACSMISFRMQMVFLWVRSGRNKQPVLCSLVMLRWFFFFGFFFANYGVNLRLCSQLAAKPIMFETYCILFLKRRQNYEDKLFDVSFNCRYNNSIIYFVA